MNKKWYFDKVYSEFINQSVLKFGYDISYKTIDRGLIEKVGPSGIVQSIRYIVNRINGLQSGQIYHYLFLLLFSTVLFVFVSICFSNILVSLNVILFLLFVMFLI